MSKWIWVLVFANWACLSVPVPSFAQAESAGQAGPRCEAPISTCGFGPLGGELSPIEPSRSCPDGFTCTCVPSCPACRDCAAEVCVRVAPFECKTACDCAPGLGCFEGQCFAGFAPVYCCDSHTCPDGNQCQHRDGLMDRCENVDMELSCRERLNKVEKVVGRRGDRGARCREDTDCVQVATTTDCRGTCGVVVNWRAARRLEKQVSSLNRKVCADYQADGCPFLTPSCIAVEPACIEKRCVGVERRYP